MKAGLAAWKRSFGVAWSNLPGVIMLNVLWLVCSLPVITVGPATLASYWWAAHVLRDEKEERMGSFFVALKRYFWRGLLWSVAWAAVLLLAYTNTALYGQWLPPLAGAVVRMAWVYAVIFLVAMQPYLFELLVMEEHRFFEAVKRSAWQVAANPVYSHMQVVVVGLAGFVAWRTTTMVCVLVVALVMVWWAVAACEVPWRYGERRRVERDLRDVL
ncbi:MAG TPA: YesL family protein [Symbiobacteriaceae bacterium]|nr:YesL family protein [Symbiobacteriaceae bacterium]